MISMKKKNHKKKTEELNNDQRLLIYSEAPFAIREAYIKLRTNMMFCMTANKERTCKVFAITSPKPAEGKSLTSANIAISFAMLGKQTLLIDTDMRKPAQKKIWGIAHDKGLCDFLANICPLELTKVEGIPLSIACSGTIPPNPSELLSSDKMRQFIKLCVEKYDYVILDTPPINTVADAQIISTFVDGMIILAKSGYTTSDELKTAIEMVTRAGGNLCGIILNDLNMKSRKYSYRYKNKYAGEYSDYYEDVK